MSRLRLLRCVLPVLTTIIIPAATAIILAAAALAAGTSAETKQKTAGPPAPGYALAWADEFDGRKLDTEKWGYRALGPRKGGVNVRDTVALDGAGRLVLTVRRSGDTYHAAMIGTQGKYETALGYFEVRVKLQKEIGHWSAFWLQTPAMGKHIGDPGRAGTEIDVFEYLRKKGDVIQHTLHWDGYGKDHKHKAKIAKVPGIGTGWHTVGLLWTPEKYAFYVDGRKTGETTAAVSRRSQYLILSCEVGKWAGDIAKADLPDRLLVDYVRVYKKKDG